MSAQANPIPVPVDVRPAGRRALALMGQYGTVVGLLGMIAAFSIAAPNQFPTVNNLLNVLDQAALTAIVAGGLTLPLVVGEFDMSIGYNASLAGVLAAGLMVKSHMAVPVAIAIVLAAGAAIGIINGLIITRARVNALIATLGTGTVLVGLNFGYAAGVPIADGLPNGFLNLSTTKVAGIPLLVLIMGVILLALWVLLNQTDLGRRIQAVGGNQEAARLSGIRVERVKTAAFVVSGLCAAATGILLASRLGSGESSAGDTYLLDSFAACFLGSATLRDGEFHVLGTLIGVLIVAVGFNGIAIFGLSTFWQYIFKGSVLVIAVALSTLSRRYSKA
jgi:ribose transport system permease protein